MGKDYGYEGGDEAPAVPTFPPISKKELKFSCRLNPSRLARFLAMAGRSLIRPALYTPTGPASLYGSVPAASAMRPRSDPRQGQFANCGPRFGPRIRKPAA